MQTTDKAKAKQKQHKQKTTDKANESRTNKEHNQMYLETVEGETPRASAISFKECPEACIAFIRAT